MIHRWIFLCAILLWNSSPSFAWGFWAHQRINYMACFSLPTPLFNYYKPHIGYLFDHAVDPDKRRYSDPQEAPRHFIDLDRYGGTDAVPHRWTAAVEKFTADTLLEHGIVPWAIQQFYFRLVNAFRDREEGKILYYSAVLGHYVGDAHVPLHCTRNYNGQLTGQKGIHGFWESRLPELFGSDYDFITGECHYLENPLETAWAILKKSAAAVDSVLTFEAEISCRMPPDLKFTFEERGNTVVRTYSRKYAAAYHERLDGQVERRMMAAVNAVACYWYSAWIDAGQPALTTSISSPTMNYTEEVKDSTTSSVHPGHNCDQDQ